MFWDDLGIQWILAHAPDPPKLWLSQFYFIILSRISISHSFLPIDQSPMIQNRCHRCSCCHRPFSISMSPLALGILSYTPNSLVLPFHDWRRHPRLSVIGNATMIHGIIVAYLLARACTSNRCVTPHQTHYLRCSCGRGFMMLFFTMMRCCHLKWHFC
jgi:hypothetical protein